MESGQRLGPYEIIEPLGAGSVWAIVGLLLSLALLTKVVSKRWSWLAR